MSLRECPFYKYFALGLFYDVVVGVFLTISVAFRRPACLRIVLVATSELSVTFIAVAMEI